MARRVTLLSMLGALVVTLVVTAASSAATRNESSSSASGTLTIATIEDVRSPDNIKEGGTTTDKLMMGSTVYEPLFTTGKSTELQPALALSAKANKAYTTWTVALRHNVKFSNGKRFTAADVKANFDAFQSSAIASTFVGDLANVAAVTVTNPYTVQFQLKLPDAHFPQVTEDTMFIADLSARANPPLLAPGEIPVGTGPYKWSARSPGSSVTFEPNPFYWRGKPPIAKVVFQVITNGQNAVLALQKGEVDMVANYVPPQTLPALKADKNIRIVARQGSTEYHAFTNFEKDYKNAKSVHQGLQYLMNTAVVIPKLIGDFGPVATQPVPRWQAGNDPKLKSLPFDTAKGQQLLADGGIPKGGTIKLLALTDRPYLCDWATATQSQLRALGYNAQLDCQPSAVAPTQVKKYDWDLLFWRNSGRALAGITYQQRWGVAVANRTDTYTLKDPTLQKIIEQMAATVDPKKYAALGAQAARRIVVTNAADIPGYFDEAYFPIQKRVKGFVLSPMTWYGILYNAINKVTVVG
jgi:peptide/nickel transport system substrate-binding protein